MNMLTESLTAEIIFSNPDAMTAAAPVLRKHGLEVQVLDYADPCGEPYIWVRGAFTFNRRK
jgi:hypothetical protein